MIQFSTLPLPDVLAGVRAAGSPLATTSDFALALADLAPGVALARAFPPGDVAVANISRVGMRQSLAVDGQLLPAIESVVLDDADAVMVAASPDVPTLLPHLDTPRVRGATLPAPPLPIHEIAVAISAVTPDGEPATADEDAPEAAPATAPAPSPATTPEMLAAPLVQAVQPAPEPQVAPVATAELAVVTPKRGGDLLPGRPATRDIASPDVASADEPVAVPQGDRAAPSGDVAPAAPAETSEDAPLPAPTATPSRHPEAPVPTASSTPAYPVSPPITPDAEVAASPRSSPLAAQIAHPQVASTPQRAKAPSDSRRSTVATKPPAADTPLSDPPSSAGPATATGRPSIVAPDGLAALTTAQPATRAEPTSPPDAASGAGPSATAARPQTAEVAQPLSSGPAIVTAQTPIANPSRRAATLPQTPVRTAPVERAIAAPLTPTPAVEQRIARALAPAAPPAPTQPSVTPAAVPVAQVTTPAPTPDALPAAAAPAQPTPMPIAAAARQPEPVAVASTSPAPTPVAAAVSVSVPAPTPARVPDSLASAPVTVTVAALPATPPPVPLLQPAAQAFAAAMFAAAAPLEPVERETADDIPLALVPDGTSTVVSAPTIAVAAPSQGQQPALDLSRGDWMASMIDRIESLRDESGAVRETRMKLAPDALGQVEVSVRRDETGAMQVRIAADTPQARAILAEAAPKLAEMAEARGVKLGGASVDAGAGSPDHQRRDAPAAPAPRRPVRAANDTVTADTDSRIA